MQKLPVSLLKSWFLSSRRELPWRANPTPYGVWISEVMLQQTQVAVVIAYYKRWMDRFPSIQHLAQASIDEVIKLWEGLGYYSRARSLHKAAQYIVAHHDGALPSSRTDLEKIPGLGPYTVGAILSFAFHKKAAAVDGNVVRVLTRFAAMEEDVCTTKAKKWVWDFAETSLPEEEPWLVVEGLIELGATICTRQPKCFQCPLVAHCLGLQKGIADLLPIKSKKVAITPLKRQVAVIFSGEFFLLRKGEKGNLMADLYEFPYLEGDTLLIDYLTQVLQVKVSFVRDLPTVQHSFTRYRATLYPSIWEAKQRRAVLGFEWIEASLLKSCPFSAGHRRILNALELEDAHFTH